MEVLRGRIIRQFPGKGIGQMAGRIGVAAEDICRCKTTLHAALPGHKNSINTLIAKPGRIDHTADIHDDNDLREGRLGAIKEGTFLAGQIEISLRENLRCHPALPSLAGVGFIIEFNGLPANAGNRAVPTLTGETADRHYGRI